MPLASPEPHLYDLVATRDGVRVSPTCPDGHVLVMELVERLGLLDRMQAGRPGMVDRGFMLDGADTAIRFPLSPPPLAMDAVALRHESVRASTPVPAPPPPSLPLAGQGANTVPIPDAISVGTTPSLPPEATVEAAAIIAGRRLSEMVALNLANLARGSKKATPATRDRRYILDLLLDVLGDKLVAEVTAEDANVMADVLASWPRHRTDYPEFLDLPARQVAAQTKKRKLTTIQRGTQYKHIMGLNAFFNWCVETKTISENPFHYVDTSRYREAIRKKKDIFSAQDLQAIFAPQHLSRYTEPHKYWVPLISLFTGMRVNEISQLYVDDIQTDTETDEDGVEHTITYFDITPFRDGQSIKTVYSVRRIPVPARLLELGIERYVADVRASGSEHLFPGLQWPEGGPGRTTSRWFNQHHLRHTCGITSTKKSLHCFRHTLTTRCDRAHVPKSVIQTINGHSDGQGVDARTYVARGSLLECKRALDGVTYPPLELVPYVPERFAAYLTQVATQAAHAGRLREEGKPVVSRKGRRPKFTPRPQEDQSGEADCHDDKPPFPQA